MKKIKKQMQISWDNVQLNPNKVGHLEIVLVNLLSNGTKMQAWQNAGRIVIISWSINFNICFVYSKELSHWVPQTYVLVQKKKYFDDTLLSKGLYNPTVMSVIS